MLSVKMVNVVIMSVVMLRVVPPSKLKVTMTGQTFQTVSAMYDYAVKTKHFCP
jgi:hypothetical protein